MASKQILLASSEIVGSQAGPNPKPSTKSPARVPSWRANAGPNNGTTPPHTRQQRGFHGRRPDARRGNKGAAASRIDKRHYRAATPLPKSKSNTRRARRGGRTVDAGEAVRYLQAIRDEANGATLTKAEEFEYQLKLNDADELASSLDLNLDPDESRRLRSEMKVLPWLGQQPEKMDVDVDVEVEVEEDGLPADEKAEPPLLGETEDEGLVAGHEADSSSLLPWTEEDREVIGYLHEHSPRI